MQAGNSIGGAISADGSLVVAQNYTPGGIKVFDAATLELLADVPAACPAASARASWAWPTCPQRRFIYSLFDAGAICIADCSNPRQPRVTTLEHRPQPYDALVSPNGRHYIAGLFGEDGLAMVDLWEEQPQARRILGGYGRGKTPAGVQNAAPARLGHGRGHAFLPPLAATRCSWSIPHLAEVGASGGRPAGVRRSTPDGRQVWVNFSVPDYNRVQVIDTPSQRVVQPSWNPAKAVLHMEFTPRGESVWIRLPRRQPGAGLRHAHRAAAGQPGPWMRPAASSSPRAHQRMGF